MNNLIDEEVLDIESETLVNILQNNNDPIVREYKVYEWSDNFMANLVTRLRKDGYKVKFENKRVLKVTRR